MAKTNFEKQRSVVIWVRDKKIIDLSYFLKKRMRENVYHCSSSGRCKKLKIFPQSSPWIE